MIHNKYSMYSALKLLIGVLFILIAIPGNEVVAQDWFLVESGVTANLYDIQFVDKTTGWAVGADSTIIKTTDGGHTWFQQTGGVAGQYRCLFFVDENHGWIGGKDSVLLHTTNGGLSWERQALTAVMDVNRVFFLNPDTGWIAAADGPCGTYFCNGALLKTTNAGETWEENLRTPLILSYDSTAVDSIFKGRYHDVVFLNDTVGFACGEIFNDRLKLGSVISTYDGGETWEHVADWERWTATYRMCIVSNDSIYVATNVGVGRTFDRGVTNWEFLQPFSTAFDISNLADGCVFALGELANEVKIRQYCSGTIQPVYQELEGKPQGVDNDERGLFMGLFMFDTTSGWICGNDGKLWSKPGINVGVGNLGSVLPTGIKIHSIFPNPLIGSGKTLGIAVDYSIAYESKLTLEIYNPLGMHVQTIRIPETVMPGRHTLKFDLPELRSGMYFCRLRGDSQPPNTSTASTISVLVVK